MSVVYVSLHLSCMYVTYQFYLQRKVVGFFSHLLYNNPHKIGSWTLMMQTWNLRVITIEVLLLSSTTLMTPQRLILMETKVRCQHWEDTVFTTKQEALTTASLSNSTGKHVAILRKNRAHTDTDTNSHTDLSVPMILNRNRPNQLENKMKVTSGSFDSNESSMKVTSGSFDSNESSIKPRKRRRLKRTLGRAPYWTSQESITSETTNGLYPQYNVKKDVSNVEGSTAAERKTVSISIKHEKNC